MFLLDLGLISLKKSNKTRAQTVLGRGGRGSSGKASQIFIFIHLQWAKMDLDGKNHFQMIQFPSETRGG